MLDSVAPAMPENLAQAEDAVDLDLDISSPAPLDEVKDSVSPPITAAGDLPSLELPEFGADLPVAGTPAPAPADAPLEFGVDLPSLEPVAAPTADAGGMDFGIEVPPVPAPAPAFDLGDISLDLDEPAAPAPAAEPESVADLSSDPMARKLELADEFRQIGDADGARELLQEVVELAQDAGLKARAQSMLDSLS
jgi:pilus assembly protein FimV